MLDDKRSERARPLDTFTKAIVGFTHIVLDKAEMIQTDRDGTCYTKSA